MKTICFAALGAFLGLLIFVFFMRYHKMAAYHTSIWGLFSFLYALMVFINEYHRYRCAKKGKSPKNFASFMLISGIVGSFFSIAAFGSYLGIAIVTEDGVSPSSYFVTIVWVWMAFKWAMVSASLGYKQLGSVNTRRYKTVGIIAIFLFQILNVAILVISCIDKKIAWNVPICVVVILVAVLVALSGNRKDSLSFIAPPYVHPKHSQWIWCSLAFVAAVAVSVIVTFCYKAKYMQEPAEKHSFWWGVEMFIVLIHFVILYVLSTMSKEHALDHCPLFSHNDSPQIEDGVSIDEKTKLLNEMPEEPARRCPVMKNGDIDPEAAEAATRCPHLAKKKDTDQASRCPYISGNQK